MRSQFGGPKSPRTIQFEHLDRRCCTLPCDGAYCSIPALRSVAYQGEQPKSVGNRKNCPTTSRWTCGRHHRLEVGDWTHCRSPFPHRPLGGRPCCGIRHLLGDRPKGAWRIPTTLPALTLGQPVSCLDSNRLESELPIEALCARVARREPRQRPAFAKMLV